MTHYQLIASNKRKSWLVVAGFITFIVCATYIMTLGFGYDVSFVGIMLIISGLTSLASYYWSDKMILGISGAKEATRETYFDFYTVTENIVMGQKMPMPKLYVIKDTAMNAFATGRDPKHAVVCATTGLLKELNRAEIEGVVAHELSHVKNYDIRLMSLVTILVGFIALLSDLMIRQTFRGKKSKNSGQLQTIMLAVSIVLALLSPLVAKLMQLAISRKREFLADASAVGMTKNPEGLVRALEKISKDRRELEAANKATAHLYFSNPLKKGKDSMHWFAKLFTTHPPVKDRIQALRSLGEGT